MAFDIYFSLTYYYKASFQSTSIIIDKNSLEYIASRLMINKLLFPIKEKSELPHNKKKIEAGILASVSDTYCQDSLVESLSHIHQIHQHTPYFAQSSIKQNSQSINSIQEMTKEFDEKVRQNPQKVAVTSLNKEGMMSKLEKTAKFSGSNHMDNISKMMSDLNATHKSMKLNLTKIKEQNKYLSSTSKKENLASKSNRNGVPSPQANKSYKCASPRYKVTGNMTERYLERLSARCKTEAAKHLEKVEAEMKECTFRPFLVSKRKSNDILALREIQNRKFEANRYKQMNKKALLNTKKEQEETGTRSFSPSFNFRHLKSIIKYEIKGLKLD